MVRKHCTAQQIQELERERAKLSKQILSSLTFTTDWKCIQYFSVEYLALKTSALYTYYTVSKIALSFYHKVAGSITRSAEILNHWVTFFFKAHSAFHPFGVDK